MGIRYGVVAKDTVVGHKGRVAHNQGGRRGLDYRPADEQHFPKKKREKVNKEKKKKKEEAKKTGDET